MFRGGMTAHTIEDFTRQAHKLSLDAFRLCVIQIQYLEVFAGRAEMASKVEQDDKILDLSPRVSFTRFDPNSRLHKLRATWCGDPEDSRRWISVVVPSKATRRTV